MLASYSWLCHAPFDPYPLKLELNHFWSRARIVEKSGKEGWDEKENWEVGDTGAFLFNRNRCNPFLCASIIFFPGYIGASKSFIKKVYQVFYMLILLKYNLFAFLINSKFPLPTRKMQSVEYNGWFCGAKRTRCGAERTDSIDNSTVFL